jgi:hypothetical protein
MAQTFLRGTQIADGTITLAKLASGYSIPTANLADGATFVRAGGTVAFTADQSVGGFKLTNLADATNPQDAMNLRSVQGLVNGIQIRSARAVSVANVALTGLQTIDGVSLTSGQIVLLRAQTTASQNGPWAVAAGAWARPSSWAAASTQKSTLFFVEEGTTYADTKWMVITDAITVDTTAVTINQDLSGTSYINGAGLGLAGNTFSVNFGQGVENDGSGNVRVKLDGTSLTRSANGIKIADGTAGRILMANNSGVATYTTVSGDATINDTGVISIVRTAGSGFLKYTDHVNNETPSGTINGSNTAFTLTSAPQNGTLQLFLNGIVLEPGAGNDFTISGTAITMLFAPLTGDKLRAYYVK